MTYTRPDRTAGNSCQPATDGSCLPSSIVPSSEKPQQGEVLSVGPGRMLDSGSRVELDLKVGDTVLFATYSGTEFKDEGDDLLILSERDVLAVIGNGTH